MYGVIYKKGKLFTKVFFLCKAFWRRFWVCVCLWKYQMIYIHLESSPLPFLCLEKVARFLKKPIIYDLDDAIFLGKNKGFRKWVKSHIKIPKQISYSQEIIVCNEYLQGYARKFNKRSQIHVISTPVDLNKFQLEKKETDLLTIGWIGSHSTFPYLKNVFDVFEHLSQKYNFVLKIVGAPERVHLKNVQIQQKPWSLEEEDGDFSDLDIGVYPLPNDSWVKGKTGYKTMQYMAAGIPCVASNVGRNAMLVQHGENGYLASSHQDWVIYLSELLSSKPLREKFREKGRKSALAQFSIEVQAPRF